MIATLLLAAFSAAWIQHPDFTGPVGDDAAQFFRFRKDFEARGPLELSVTADERYVLYLDGRRIDRGPDRGAVNDWTFRTLSLDPAPGSHRLEAVVWQAGGHAPVAQLSSGHGGFALEANGEYDAALTTGKAVWKVGRLDGPSFLPQRTRFIVFAFGRQFADEGRGFTVTEPAVWMDAEVVEKPAPQTFFWGLDSSRRQMRETILPQQLDRTVTSGVFKTGPATVNALWKEGRPLMVAAGEHLQALLDLDDYFCAYPEISVEGGGDGAEIRFGWTEALVGTDGKKGDRNAFEGKSGKLVFEDVFRPRGGTSFFTTPWWRCGRWCTLDIRAGAAPLTVTSLKLAETRYPLEDGSTFECDDPSFGGIRRICDRVLQMCSHEMLYDCPYYEQQMYPGDTRVQLRVHSVFSTDDRLIRRAITLFDRARFPDGLVPFNFPTRETQKGAAYTLCYLLMYGDYAMWHKDIPWLKERIPGLRQTVAALDGYSRADGLLVNLPTWGFVDWVDGWSHGRAPDVESAERPSSILNLLWALGLRSAALAERVAGDGEIAAFYEKKAEQVVASVRGSFFDEARGLFADDLSRTNFSEHAQCLAILADAVKGTEAERCLKAMEETQGLAKCSVYFSYYLFEAFFKLGRGDHFLKRLDLWRDYVRDGLRTTPEHPGEPRSDCHAWGAHPLYFMQTGLAGIEPASPGFASVRIVPHPGTLKRIYAKLPHPQGFVEVDFKFDGETASGTVDTPVVGTFVWGGREQPLAVGHNEIR